MVLKCAVGYILRRLLARHHSSALDHTSHQQDQRTIAIMNYSWSFVVLAVLATSCCTTSARQLLQSGECPLPADMQPDLSGLAGPCSANETLCDECLCALVTTLVPAYTAGGVTFDPEDPSSFDVQKVTEISAACAEALAPAIAEALGENAAVLAGLTECPLIKDSTAGNVSEASLPSCLTPEALTAAFSNSTMNVTASSNGTEANGTLPSDMGMDGMNGTDSMNVTAEDGPGSAAGAEAGGATRPANGSTTRAAGSSAAVATAGMTVMATVGAAALAALLL